MKSLNMFFVLTFLFDSLLLSPIKPEIISQKSEKNYILQENQDKCENSFQKIFPEKSLKKDEIFKREENGNFVEISKETGKKGKPIIKYERDENNPRKLADEENYIIVHYGSTALYLNGYRSGGNLADAITKIMYNGNEYQYNSPLTIEAGAYIEIYISSSATNMENYFLSGASSNERETKCDKIISIDLSHLKQSIAEQVSNFLYSCNGLTALDMSGINLGSVIASSGFLSEVNTLIYLNIKNTVFSSYMKQALVDRFTVNYPQNLIVCQSETILTVEKFIYKCCDFQPQEGQCALPESTIHIDIYFSEDIYYNQGFDISTESNHRDSVVFLKSGDNKINLGEPFGTNL